jgi:hypothetical protein
MITINMITDLHDANLPTLVRDLGQTASGSSEPDYVARTLAIAGLVVSTVALLINFRRDWSPIRRLIVALERTDSLYRVAGNNKGGSTLTIQSWTLQYATGSPIGTPNLDVPQVETGDGGPSLPHSVAPGEEVTLSVGYDQADRAAEKILKASDAGNDKPFTDFKRIRARVKLSTGKEAKSSWLKMR